MNSKQIFWIFWWFFKEILIDLVQIKSVKISNTDLYNKLKLILGKSISDEEIKKTISLNDEQFKNKIFKIFENSRNERIKILAEDQSKELEKRIFLQTVDMNWKSHIQYLEQLRQVIGLRSYGQRDPLVEYKKEAFDLFENLLNKLKIDLITILINLKVVQETPKISEDLKKKE